VHVERVVAVQGVERALGQLRVIPVTFAMPTSTGISAKQANRMPNRSGSV
jgi:hypothetical protein